MKLERNSAEASLFYHESTAADAARMESSAVFGNLADVMKNATVLLPPPRTVRTIVNGQLLENSNDTLNHPITREGKSEGDDPPMAPAEKPVVSVRSSDYRPSKAEMEADISIDDATADEVAHALTRTVAIKTVGRDT